jgi:hypothetical protein
MKPWRFSDSPHAESPLTPASHLLVRRVHGAHFATKAHHEPHAFPCSILSRPCPPANVRSYWMRLQISSVRCRIHEQGLAGRITRCRGGAPVEYLSHNSSRRNWLSLRHCNVGLHSKSHAKFASFPLHIEPRIFQPRDISLLSL